MTSVDVSTPWRLRCRIEHVDTDATGIVHFSRYVSLMETIALEYLEAHGAGLARFAELGADLAVTSLSVRYSSPAAYRDVVVGAATVDRVGGASIRASMRLLREEVDGSHTELACGTLTFATVHTTAGHAIPLPADIHHTLKGLTAHATRHDSTTNSADGTGRVPASGAAAS